VALLDALGVTAAQRERETIEQELAVIQAPMETTVLQLEAGGSNAAQDTAAAWLLDFVAKLGAKAQRNARKLGLLAIVVDHIAKRAVTDPASVDTFGGLLLVLLNPRLPGEVSQAALDEGIAHHRAGRWKAGAESFTAAIVGQHPDLKQCYHMRCLCHSELSMTAAAQHDAEQSEAEWIQYQKDSAMIVATLLKMGSHEPRVDVYAAMAIGHVFVGISSAPDSLIRAAFKWIVDLAIHAFDDHHPELSIRVSVELPIRWRQVLIYD
jgi:hypothetical protein